MPSAARPCGRRRSSPSRSLVAARGLARRRRRAWQVATRSPCWRPCCTHCTASTTARSSRRSCSALLVARRHDFDRPGDAATRHLLARATRDRSPARSLVYAVGGALAEPHGGRPAVLAPLRRPRDGPRLSALELGGSQHLAGRVRRLVPALAAAARRSRRPPGSSRLARAVAPPARSGGAERQLARRSSHAWGVDTLAPFVLRADKSYFFRRRRRAFLAYRVVGGVAIVSGDPIGPPEQRRGARRPLRRNALDARLADRDPRRVRALAARLRGHGLHALYHGDEAIVDTATSRSRAARSARCASGAPARNAGYTAQALRPARSAGLRTSSRRSRRLARRPARARVRDGARHALRARRRDAVFVVGFAPDGPAAGFLHFALSPASRRCRSRRCRGCARPERLQRVAHLRGRRVGARARLRPRLAELRAVRGAARARGRADRQQECSAALSAR